MNIVLGAFAFTLSLGSLSVLLDTTEPGMEATEFFSEDTDSCPGTDSVASSPVDITAGRPCVDDASFAIRCLLYSSMVVWLMLQIGDCFKVVLRCTCIL